MRLKPRPTIRLRNDSSGPARVAWGVAPSAIDPSAAAWLRCVRDFCSAAALRMTPLGVGRVMSLPALGTWHLALGTWHFSSSVRPPAALDVEEDLQVIERVVGPAVDLGVGPERHQRGHHPVHVQPPVDAGQVADGGGGVAAHPGVGVAGEVQAAALHVLPVVAVQRQAQQHEAHLAPAGGEERLGLVAGDGVELLVDPGDLVVFALVHRSSPSVRASAGTTPAMSRTPAATSPRPAPTSSTGTGFSVCPPPTSSTLPWSLPTTSSASAGSAATMPPRKASTRSSAATAPSIPPRWPA